MLQTLCNVKGLFMNEQVVVLEVLDYPCYLVRSLDCEDDPNEYVVFEDQLGEIYNGN